MGAGTALKVLFLAISLAVGIGISMFLIPDLLPFLDEQTRIIIGAVLTIFTYVSLYFMSKGQG